ncbi:hypothetical protein [Kaistella palustris]|nr:hypothetical protein [Kaistella palustris]
MFLRPLPLILTFLMTAATYGQENLLFSNDIYSGISSAGISPAQPFL